MVTVTDSHIHLLSLKNQDILKWKEGHPLHKHCRLEEYFSQNKTPNVDVDGVVMIEYDPFVDHKKGLQGYNNGIKEYLYGLRIAKGELAPDEGDNQFQNYLKAIIPIAPAPLGPQSMEQYVSDMKSQDPENFHIVKGFRYLVQDKPPGTMTESKFVDSLLWLHKHDYVFDWGIDVHSGGLWQFEETLQVVKQVPDLKYIINHLTKPNLEIPPEEIDTNPQFVQWKQYMTEIYHCTPNSYMKVSGGFSEMPPEKINDLDLCTEAVFPWFKVCFDLWGVERMLWASNWPVCALATENNQLVNKWFTVTEKLFDRVGMNEEDREKVYRHNCAKAYNY